MFLFAELLFHESLLLKEYTWARVRTFCTVDKSLISDKLTWASNLFDKMCNSSRKIFIHGAPPFKLLELVLCDVWKYLSSSGIFFVDYEIKCGFLHLVLIAGQSWFC